ALGVTLNESTRQKDVNSVFHDGLILIPGFRPFAFVFSSLGPHSTSCARSFTWELCRTCGGTLSGSGQIRSPYHPNPYPHSKTCEWVITQSPGQVVTFSFESFDIEGSSTCSFDYVEVKDGTSVSSPLIGKYCGTQMPPAAQSTQRSMYVRFVTDSSVSNHGFTAQYAAIMERKYRQTFLTSPNYPNNYPVYRECIYRIIVSVNRQIMLNFTDFALEPTYPSCLYDYVEIRDGGYETSPLTSRYCGTTTPPIIMSHSNRLWIKFRSDMTSTYRGFMAHWDGNPRRHGENMQTPRREDPGSEPRSPNCCGGTLTTSSGSFTSPNYPLPYHPNSECYWILQASGGSQEELRFEVFHLESSTNCNYDFLEVSGSNSPLLAKLCGNQIPAPIRSSRENLYVKLRTDASIGAGGFVAVYSQGRWSSQKQNQMSSSVSVCQGVVIRGLNRGVLESPNYPGLYPHSKHCNWTIEATVGNTVNYTFTAFSMEPYCNYDYLYDGPDSQSTLIGTFCGSSPPPPNTTTGRHLHVVFASDPSVSHPGFQMLWFQNGCGGVFTAPAGELHSPNFPSPYPPNVDCSWVLNVDRGHRVLLTFNEFEIENHNACNYDYLVYDGPDANAPLLGKLCGLNMPAAITATQSTMYIRFRSDSSFNHKGFSTAAMSLELHSRSFDI
uniref:CUB domain-containing protein n=1 Tax=Erpetoichthys calabaricus TaxID=27687 RepID=A0A8C4TP22_ERPCA